MGNSVGRLPGSPPLQIKMTVHDGQVEAELAGELDLATAPLVLAAARSHVMGRQVKVVMDLHRIEFMDCAGLSALLLVARRVRSAGGQVALLQPSRSVRRLFEICNVAAMPGITIDDSRGPAALSHSGTIG